MTMEKDICKPKIKDLNRLVELVNEYCKKNDIPELKKDPMTGRTIYITKFPEKDKE